MKIEYDINTIYSLNRLVFGDNHIMKKNKP